MVKHRLHVCLEFQLHGIIVKLVVEEHVSILSLHVIEPVEYVLHHVGPPVRVLPLLVSVVRHVGGVRPGRGGGVLCRHLSCWWRLPVVGVEVVVLVHVGLGHELVPAPAVDVVAGVHRGGGVAVLLGGVVIAAASTSIVSIRSVVATSIRVTVMMVASMIISFIVTSSI